jgi:hypothetical protein
MRVPLAFCNLYSPKSKVDQLDFRFQAPAVCPHQLAESLLQERKTERYMIGINTKGGKWTFAAACTKVCYTQKTALQTRSSQAVRVDMPE